jgi:hypothetical protein
MGWYIIIKTIYTDKIEAILSFEIESSRKLSIGVKFEVDVKKWSKWSCLCCCFFISIVRGIVMESN